MAELPYWEWTEGVIKERRQRERWRTTVIGDIKKGSSYKGMERYI